MIYNLLIMNINQGQNIIYKMEFKNIPNDQYC